MPIIKSAIKRMKQTAKRRERNVETKKGVKSAVKAFNENPTAKGLQAAQSEIDTAVKKNILNKRTAARRKSQLVKIAKAAGVKVEASSKGKVVSSKVKTPAKTTAVKKPAATKTVTKTVAKPVVAKKPAAKKPAVKKAVAKKPVAK